MRVNPRQSNVKAVYKTHIDVIHFRKTDEKRLHGVDEDAEQKLFTEDRVQTLKELAAKPDVYERLSSALAPSIYEHEDIKKVCVWLYMELDAIQIMFYFGAQHIACYMNLNWNKSPAGNVGNLITLHIFKWYQVLNCTLM